MKETPFGVARQHPARTLVLTLSMLTAASCSERTKPAPGLGEREAGLAPEGGVYVDSAAPTDSVVTRDVTGALDGAVAKEEAGTGDVSDVSPDAGPDNTTTTPRPWGCPEEPPEALPREVLGWADVEGYDTSTTVGGLGGEVVSATSEQELRDLAADPLSKVIAICGTITLTSRLPIASNKTLVGIGDKPLIRGGLDVIGTRGEYVSNVIIRDLTIDGSTIKEVLPDRLPGIRMEYAHHVWLDHLEMFNAPQGLIDVVFGSNYVTISWSKFYFTETTPDVEHRFGIRVGDETDDTVFSRDGGKLRVTLHHNWFAEYIRQRFPRVAYGQAHVVNNYYSTVGNDTAIWGASQFAHVLVESNYFNGTTNPHEIVYDEMAQVVARGNIYDATVGLQETNGAVFEPPYSFPLDATAIIPGLVQWGAGPNKGTGPRPQFEPGVGRGDAGSDAGPDASSDAGPDASSDAGSDAGRDASSGAGPDPDGAIGVGLEGGGVTDGAP